MTTSRGAVAATLLVGALLGCSAGAKDDLALPAQTCDQDCLDGSLLFATWLSVDADLYNDRVVNHALPQAGVACPGGGTVDISGTATNVGGTNTLDLTYVLAACRFTASGHDLTYTGTVAEKGEFNNDTKVTNLSYSSERLTWTGTVGYGSTPFATSGDACSFSMTKRSSLSGSLCGRHEVPGRTPP